MTTTPMPASPFLSNSAASDTAADTAVAPNLQPPTRDATAVLNSVSDGAPLSSRSCEMEPFPAYAPSESISPDVHIAPHNSGEREPVSDAGLPPGGSSSDGDPLGQGAKSVLQAGYAGAAFSSSEASAAITLSGRMAAVDLQALWDCITDDRIVLIGRGDDPDRPMFLETFRLGEAAAE